MFPLSETALPINAMTMWWLEQHFHHLCILDLLCMLINSIQDRYVSLFSLFSISLVWLAKSTVVQLISNLLYVVYMVLPNVLVFIIIFKHIGLSITDWGQVEGGVVFEFLGYLLVRLFSCSYWVDDLLNIPIGKLSRVLLEIFKFKLIDLAWVKLDCILILFSLCGLPLYNSIITWHRRTRPFFKINGLWSVGNSYAIYSYILRWLFLHFLTNWRRLPSNLFSYVHSHDGSGGAHQSIIPSGTLLLALRVMAFVETCLYFLGKFSSDLFHLKPLLVCFGWPH